MVVFSAFGIHAVKVRSWILLFADLCANLINGIKSIHYVAACCITDNTLHPAVHINTSNDIRISQGCIFKNNIEQLLRDKYSIRHCTLQFEYNSCENIPLVRN